MRRHKLLGIGLAIFGLLIQWSCKKYLEEKSDNSLVIPTTLQDAQALLDNDLVMNRTTPAYMESSSDNYFVPANVYASRGSVFQNIYTWRPYDYVGPAVDWGANYNAIYYSNLSLETLEKIAVTDNNKIEWNNAHGSALFYRALNFLQLTWAFAKAYDESTSDLDLGIVLKLESDFNVPNERATVKQSYEQVVRDLKESIIYLPDFPLITTRPSKRAAYGLLARTYLSMRQYDSALKYSNLSLQINGQLMDYGNPPVNPSNSVPFPDFKSNPEIIFFQQLTAYHLTIQMSLVFVDTTLYASYASDDWRKTAFFVASTTVSPTGLVYQKYKGSYTNSSTTFFSGITTAEMYLIRAECYARVGNKTAALADLNSLLRRRHTASFIDVTATDANAALEIILLERKKELLMRGLRWIDIKRLNKEGRNITLTRNTETIYTLQPNANYYALPLPVDVIAMTGWPQNPYP